MKYGCLDTQGDAANPWVSGIPYNAPGADRLREHYEDLPAKLRAEKIDPRVPWLYGFMVDYRMR